MHARRAHVAGFGIAGALLAGSAMLFMLASAILGFRGWPSGTRSAPAIHVLVGRPAAGGADGASSSARRLVALTVPAPGPARRLPVGGAGSHVRSSSPPGAGAHPHGATPGSTHGPSGSGGTRAPQPGMHSGAPTPTRPPITCAGRCGRMPGGGLSTVVAKVRYVAGSAVSQTGSGVAGTVENATGHLPGAVVPKVGAIAGATVSGTAGRLGSVLAGG